MEFCTNRYAEPNDELLDWCIDITPDIGFCSIGFRINCFIYGYEESIFQI